MIEKEFNDRIYTKSTAKREKYTIFMLHLTKMPQCKEIFPVMEEMYQCHYWIPEYAEYRTALGAALAYTHK